MKHILIIGNGISGITTARYIRKLSDHQITVISSETEHFFSRTALMYVYMGHMKYEHIKPYEDWFWKKNRIDLIFDHVTGLDTDQKQVHRKSGSPVSYDILVLATGSRYNTFGWPGETLDGVSGLYSYQDLQTIERNTKNIQRGVIVGGGLIGIELAEMLHSRKIAVTFLVREKNFWNVVLPDEEASLVSRHIRKQNIDLRLQTELKEILPDNKGRVRAVVTKSGEEIPSQFVGLATGVHPNIEAVKNSGIKTDRGILVDKYLQTSVEDVYAIGDCAQHVKPPGQRKTIEQVWYTGRMMGETVAHTICGIEVPYKPGIWFNSAKFFDIEYQTYGWVANELNPEEDSIYAENEGGNRCLRLVYDKKSRALKGINALGVRIRHDVAEDWIKSGIAVEKVVRELPTAHFDTEFTTSVQSLFKKLNESLEV